jgi:hypothetical protein
MIPLLIECLRYPNQHINVHRRMTVQRRPAHVMHLNQVFRPKPQRKLYANSIQ